MPSIGNGHVAVVVKGDTVFLNGLYNGHNITSHRAKLPAVFIKDIDIKSTDHLKTNYTLDLAAGEFIAYFVSVQIFTSHMLKNVSNEKFPPQLHVLYFHPNLA